MTGSAHLICKVNEKLALRILNRKNRTLRENNEATISNWNFRFGLIEDDLKLAKDFFIAPIALVEIDDEGSFLNYSIIAESRIDLKFSSSSIIRAANRRLAILEEFINDIVYELKPKTWLPFRFENGKRPRHTKFDVEDFYKRVQKGDSSSNSEQPLYERMVSVKKFSGSFNDFKECISDRNIFLLLQWINLMATFCEGHQLSLSHLPLENWDTWSLDFRLRNLSYADLWGIDFLTLKRRAPLSLNEFLVGRAFCDCTILKTSDGKLKVCDIDVKGIWKIEQVYKYELES